MIESRVSAPLAGANTMPTATPSPIPAVKLRNYRDRMEEEWRSDINEIPGVIARILASADLLRAAHMIGLGAEQSLHCERWSRVVEMCFSACSKMDIVADAIQMKTPSLPANATLSNRTLMPSSLLDAGKRKS